MSTCFDIYVMPSGCNTIWTYPSQTHPSTDTGGGGTKHYVQRFEPAKKKRRHDTDEDVWAYLHLP